MKRGTTYTQALTIAGVDLTPAAEVIVSLKPIGKPPMEFSGDSIIITSDGTDTVILYRLTEAQSLSLDTGSFQVDVNWMMDGTRGGTHIATRQVSRTLLNRIIGGGSDTPSATDAQELDPLTLTAEQVQIIKAVSPRVTNVAHSGNATLVTIEDVAGAHVISLPDPVRGVDYWTSADKSEVVRQASEGISGKLTSLDDTPLVSGVVVEAAGIPVYVADPAQYADYGLAEKGWYIFARVWAEPDTLVTESTRVTGAAAILTEGADHVDLAVRFDVAARSALVTVEWGGYTDSFAFKATDLAVRNLDYMARFYVYDIADFATWEYVLTTDTAFVAGNRYFTLTEGVYTEAVEGEDWTAGDAIPADTYYKHSHLTLAGMTPNVTYRLDEKLDCPLSIALPEVADDGHGAWFEIQMNYSSNWSCTLLPPEGVKIGTATTQAQSKGVNVLDLQYTNVDGVAIWTLLNTHSNVPA